MIGSKNNNATNEIWVVKTNVEITIVYSITCTPLVLAGKSARMVRSVYMLDIWSRTSRTHCTCTPQKNEYARKHAGYTIALPTVDAQRVADQPLFRLRRELYTLHRTCGGIG